MAAADGWQACDNARMGGPELSAEQTAGSPAALHDMNAWIRLGPVVCLGALTSLRASRAATSADVAGHRQWACSLSERSRPTPTPRTRTDGSGSSRSDRAWGALSDGRAPSARAPCPIRGSPAVGSCMGRTLRRPSPLRPGSVAHPGVPCGRIVHEAHPPTAEPPPAGLRVPSGAPPRSDRAWGAQPDGRAPSGRVPSRPLLATGPGRDGLVREAPAHGRRTASRCVGPAHTASRYAAGHGPIRVRREVEGQHAHRARHVTVPLRRPVPDARPRQTVGRRLNRHRQVAPRLHPRRPRDRARRAAAAAARALHGPDSLRPDVTRQDLIEDAARKSATLAIALSSRGHELRAVGHFLDQLLSCLFAEDAGLLPAGLMSDWPPPPVGTRVPSPVPCRTSSRMPTRGGGLFVVERIEWSNGSLFDGTGVLPLTAPEVETILKAAKLDWAEIEPHLQDPAGAPSGC